MEKISPIHELVIIGCAILVVIALVYKIVEPKTVTTNTTTYDYPTD